jgi:hypothetical protein
MTRILRVASTSLWDGDLAAVEDARSPASQRVAGVPRLVWSRLRRRRVIIGAALAVAALSWPLVPIQVAPDLDNSWRLGLQIAADRGLNFGPQLLFTYGPLGYLVSPTVAVGVPGVLSMLVLGTLWLALAACAVVLLARVFPWPVAGSAALALLMLMSPVVPLNESAVATALILTLTVASLLGHNTRWTPRIAALLGAGGTVGPLTKADAGVVIWSLLAVSVIGGAWCRRGRRAALINAGAFGGAAVVAFPAWWLISGQPVSALPRWITGMSELTRGYPRAMGLESEGALWEYAAALVLAVTIVAMLWTTRQIAVGIRVAVTVELTLGLYYLFRSGFTRHQHRGPIFFLAFLLVPMAFVTAWSRREVLLVLLLGVTVMFASTGLSIDAVLDPGPRLSALDDTLHVVFSKSSRADFIRARRAEFVRTYGLTEPMLRRLRTGTVHVLPWDAGGVIFAYPFLRWQPLPILQDYSAYTEDLDGRNADVLASRAGPHFVLRRPGIALDSRFPRFESPREQLELLCRYRVVRRDPGWDLLEVGRDRCGHPVLDRRVHARYGVTVPLPATRGELVLGRFSGVGDSLDARLATLLIRAPDVWVSPDTSTWYRFVSGDQHSWHVLAAPTCAAAELGATGGAFSSLTLSDRQGLSEAHDGYTVEIARVPYQCGSR